MTTALAVRHAQPTSAGPHLASSSPAPSTPPADHSSLSERTPWCDATDRDLILAVRSGDPAAVEALYLRHHCYALRVAGRMSNPSLAEDLASEALTKVIGALTRGKGPDHLIRPYLATTIRHLFFDTIRKRDREVLVDDHERLVDDVQPDATELLVERSLILEVLAELPERWREILWRTIVLSEPLDAVAATMGLRPNAAAQLSFRARKGLSKAYFQRFPPSLEGAEPRLAFA